MYKRVIILDNGWLIHRAIFCFSAILDDISRFFEEPTTTYMRMIVGNLKQLKFNPNEDLVIIAMDSRNSWRKDIDIIYKSTRAKKREQKQSAEWWGEMYKEFDNFILYIENHLPFLFVKHNRSEADDICSVATRFFKDKEIIIVSPDSDMEQLTYFKNVKVFSSLSHKFKEIKNPILSLQKKVNTGDSADDLTKKPITEEERNIRNKIVNLIAELPPEIEYPIRNILENLPIKQLKLSGLRVPIRVKKGLYQLFNR